MSSSEEPAELDLERPTQRRARPVLRGSERELKAFVSSVMRGDLQRRHPAGRWLRLS